MNPSSFTFALRSESGNGYLALSDPNNPKTAWIATDSPAEVEA